MVSIPFMKLSGAGNDFVIIDNRNSIVPDLSTSFVQKVCQRRISIGADGLLLVENSEIADFKMRYFNADGGEAETCGNGSRCISKFAFVNEIADRRMKFETEAGIYSAEIIGENVRVLMSDPTDIRLNFPLELRDRDHEISFANTGVPHVVFTVDDLKLTDVIKIGRETRHHDDFKPAGTNVNFISIRSENEIDIRTYERGVEDETLACGTGSIASAIVSALDGKVRSPVKVNSASGFVLTVYFDLNNQIITNVNLEGDARIVCEGVIKKSAWNY